MRKRTKKATGQSKKYHNKKIEAFGMKFDSEREYQRYLFLKEKEENGEISDLKSQVKFELIPKVEHEEIVHLKTKDKTKLVCDQLPITYKCDFTYLKRDGTLIVEDVKISPYLIPKEFTIKQKLFFWKYHMHIKLVFNPTEDI